MLQREHEPFTGNCGARREETATHSVPQLDDDLSTPRQPWRKLHDDDDRHRVGEEDQHRREFQFGACGCVFVDDSDSKRVT